MTKHEVLLEVQAAEKGIRSGSKANALSHLGKAKEGVKTLREPQREVPPPPPPEPETEVPVPSPPSHPAPYESCFLPAQGAAPKFGLLHIEASDRLRKEADPKGQYKGGDVLGYYVREGDQLQWSGNPRTETQGHTGLIKPNEVFAWGSDFLIPNDFPQVNGWCSLLSVYGSPAGYESPIRIEIKGGGSGDKFGWQRSRLYGYDIPWQIPTPRGVWVSVKIQELLSSQGWVELWYWPHDGRAKEWIKVTFFAGSGKATDKLQMNTIDQITQAGSQHCKAMQYRKIGMPGFDKAKLYPIWSTGVRVGPEHLSVEDPYGFKE